MIKRRKNFGMNKLVIRWIKNFITLIQFSYYFHGAWIFYLRFVDIQWPFYWKENWPDGGAHDFNILPRRWLKSWFDTRCKTNSHIANQVSLHNWISKSIAVDSESLKNFFNSDWMLDLTNQRSKKNHLRVTQSEFIIEFFEKLIRLIGSARVL